MYASTIYLKEELSPEKAAIGAAAGSMALAGIGGYEQYRRDTILQSIQMASLKLQNCLAKNGGSTEACQKESDQVDALEKKLASYQKYLKAKTALGIAGAGLIGGLGAYSMMKNRGGGQ